MSLRVSLWDWEFCLRVYDNYGAPSSTSRRAALHSIKKYLYSVFFFLFVYFVGCDLPKNENENENDEDDDDDDDEEFEG